jgi:hypothetical protein
MKYPTRIIIKKFNSRNIKTNQLLFFLPDMPNENCNSINQAKTRNGNPRSLEISENRTSCSGEMYVERKALITT